MIRNDHLLWIVGFVVLAVILFFPSEEEIGTLPASDPVTTVATETPNTTGLFGEQEAAVTFARSETFAVADQAMENGSELRRSQTQGRSAQLFVPDDRKVETVFRPAGDFAAGVPFEAKAGGCADAGCRRR